MNTISAQDPGGGFRAALTAFGRRLDQQPLKGVVLLVAIIVSAACGWFAWIGPSPTTPDGILGLEFPGTRSGAVGALTLLDNPTDLPDAIGRTAVLKSLGFDVPFIAGYAVALFIILRWCARQRIAAHEDAGGRLVDGFAPFAPLVAGLFDLGEDAGLWRLLYLGPPYAHAGLIAGATTICATAKFTLLTFAMFYAAYAIGSRQAVAGSFESGGPEPARPTLRENARAAMEAGRERLRQIARDNSPRVRLR